jgi:hypothetical protein
MLESSYIMGEMKGLADGKIQGPSYQLKTPIFVDKLYRLCDTINVT